MTPTTGDAGREADETRFRVDSLGQRLGALRLCEPEAVATMRRSLERHGQRSAVAVFATDAGVEVIDGFKRLRAARAPEFRPEHSLKLGSEAQWAAFGVAG